MRTLSTFALISCIAFLNAEPLIKKNRHDKKAGLIENLEVKFIENKGQMVDIKGAPTPYVWFKASAPGVDLYLTEKGLTYVFIKHTEEEESRRRKRDNEKIEERHRFEWERVEMTLQGANLSRANIVKEGAGAEDHHFYSDHCLNGIKGVKQYERLIYKDVYPGIDWVFYNAGKKGFKYDFIVHPGADASKIKMIYSSLHPLELQPAGGLFISTQLGTLHEEAPYSFVQESGEKVNSGFTLNSIRSNRKYQSVVSFTLAEHAAAQTLVIDPNLIWATFYGGSSFEGTYCLDSDASGNLFMCGYTASLNLPLVDAGFYYQSNPNATFVLKFSAAGALVWATYLGTSSGVFLTALDVDKFGNVFIVGQAQGAVTPTLNAGTYFQGTSAGAQDVIIMKFSNSGNLLWGTYYGGSSQDGANAVITDHMGNVFVGGFSSSSNFPLQNAGTYFNSTSNSNNGFILKFDNAGNRLWATFYDEILIYGMAVDNLNNLIMCGNSSPGFATLDPGSGAYYQPAVQGFQDAALLKFDNAGNLFWSTNYGGSSSDLCRTVVTDKNNNIFLSGTTNSNDFPVQNAGTYFQGTLNGTMQDMFIVKFNPAGVRQWATYFGGTKLEVLSSGDNMAVDTCDNVYVTFETLSANMPVVNPCEGGYQDSFLDTTMSTNSRDLFLTRFSNTGTLLWSTYLGGSGMDFRIAAAVDPFNCLVLTGEWVAMNNNSHTYPVTNPGGLAYMDSTGNGSDDVYILKFENATTSQSFSYQSPVCNNSTVTLLPITGGSSTTTGQWASVPGLSLDPGTGAITPSASAAGVYTVAYPSSQCLCSASTVSASIATVTILAGPNIVLTGTNTICIKNSGTITATGANTYTWHTGAQSSSLVLTPVSNTILTVTGSNANGCISTASVLVKVNSCVGTEEFFGEHKLQVYANPNHGDFIVSSSKEMQLEIVNVLGQHVMHVTLNESNNFRVDVNGLAAGIYFLRNEGAGEKFNHKIVVER